MSARAGGARSTSDRTTVAIIGRRSDPSLQALADCLREREYAVEHLDVTRDVPQRVTQISPIGLVVDLRDGAHAREFLAWYCTNMSPSVLSVTHQTDVVGRMYALEHGVADHVVAPFALDEAVARVEALLEKRQPDHGNLYFAGITVDPTHRVATRGGTPIDLTRRELDVLVALMRNPSRVTSKDELLEQAWPTKRVSQNAVEAVISALRRKLQTSQELIHTVHRAGYTLREPPRPAVETGRRDFTR
jgi:DNA-binding response OmpR family regulator